MISRLRVRWAAVTSNVTVASKTDIQAGLKTKDFQLTSDVTVIGYLGHC
jgi:hypothetical protein